MIEALCRRIARLLLDNYPSADHHSGIPLLMEQAVLPQCLCVHVHAPGPLYVVCTQLNHLK